MKKILMLFVTLSAVFALGACGGDDIADDPTDGTGEQETTDDSTDGTDEQATADDELEEFTLEELSQYDGTDGSDAYVAVDGYVYDMTDSAYWNDGSHQNSVQAGQDLTDEIDMDSPHGRSTLERVPKIGILVESNGGE